MSQYAALTIQYRGGAKEKLVMPHVKAVDRTTSVSLTEISTMIYGYRNNFCMDLGTTWKLTFSFVRMNPMPYNDASSDPERWSNGKWYRHLEELLDRWQNLCVNPEKPSEQSGGFIFEFKPDDSELYPPFRENVFMVGNLNMSYKATQKMEFSLPLVVSKMTGSVTHVETIDLTLSTESIVDNKTYTSTYAVPKGYLSPVPECPGDWGDLYQPGRSFRYWTDSSGNIYEPGVNQMWTEPVTLYARWRGVYDIHAIIGTGYEEYTIPEGVTRAMVILVGGGGGAGGSVWYKVQNALTSVYTVTEFLGGGGGGGEAVRTSEIPVMPGKKIRIELGEGGSPGTNSGSFKRATNGGNGGDTLAYYDGEPWPGVSRARGGEGGKKAVWTDDGEDRGAGGSIYQAGGTSKTDGRGSNGSTASPNISDNAGRGGAMTYSYKADRKHIYNIKGGNGGGAAAFRYRFYLDSKNKWTPAPEKYFTSYGGDGQSYPEADFKKRVARTKGTARGSIGGGGGGSGWKDGSDTGAGGESGCALIVMYEG